MSTNYLPITLLELPANILEIINNNRFICFCEEKQSFNKNQYGFLRGQGTDVALAKIDETIAISQNCRYHCNVVCRDISKAFDKIWHGGLKLKILSQNDLPSTIQKMLISYITGRDVQLSFE